MIFTKSGLYNATCLPRKVKKWGNQYQLIRHISQPWKKSHFMEKRFYAIQNKYFSQSAKELLCLRSFLENSTVHTPYFSTPVLLTSINSIYLSLLQRPKYYQSNKGCQEFEYGSWKELNWIFFQKIEEKLT